MKHIIILKPGVVLGILAAITIATLTFRPIADMAIIPATLFIVIFLIISANKTIKWINGNILDRNRYHISNLDKDGGCYRVDQKTGSVQYIEPKTGCLSAAEQRAIAEDEERMYRENEL